ncbi:MAG TPA: hypothetical protein VGJ20_00285 [Xanthobacteraceae bacterium]
MMNFIRPRMKHFIRCVILLVATDLATRWRGDTAGAVVFFAGLFLVFYLKALDPAPPAGPRHRWNSDW